LKCKKFLKKEVFKIMLEIVKMLLPLGLAVLMNIALGTYYNISVKDIKFDKYKLINGLIKAIIVGGSFVGLSYIVTVVNLGDFTIDPKLVMITAIGTYSVKVINNLRKILGIENLNTISETKSV